jgi:hypothetical protein
MTVAGVFFVIYLNANCLKYPIELLVYLTLAVVFFAIRRDGAQMNFLLMVILSMVYINYDINLSVKNIIIASVIALLMYCYLIYKGTFTYETYVTVDERIRNNLGFDNPNRAAMFFYAIGSLLMLTYKKNKSLIGMVGAFIIIWAFVQTNSRSILFALIIYFLCYIILWSLKGKGKHIIQILFFLVGVLSFVFPIIAQKIQVINKFTSYRLENVGHFLNQISFIELLIGAKNIAVDNSFLAFICLYGMIYFVWTVTIVLRAIGNLYDQKEYVYISFLLSYWGYGLSESVLLTRSSLGVVLFWIIVFKYAFKTKTLISYRV